MCYTNGWALSYASGVVYPWKLDYSTVWVFLVILTVIEYLYLFIFMFIKDESQIQLKHTVL